MHDPTIWLPVIAMLVAVAMIACRGTFRPLVPVRIVARSAHVDRNRLRDPAPPAES